MAPDGQGPAFPQPFLEFLRLYERGEYKEANDVMEAFYGETREPLYKGLLQVAVALYQYGRGRLGGTAKLLRKALEQFDGYPDQVMGLDLARLRRDCREALELVERVRRGDPRRRPGILLIDLDWRPERGPHLPRRRPLVRGPAAH